MSSEGELERCIALRIDITERKQAQIENNKLTSLLTNVLDAASEIAIISTDNNGIITIFNRGAELLLGYSAAEIVGKVSPAILHLPAEIRARAKELSEEFGEEIGSFDVFVYKARNVGQKPAIGLIFVRISRSVRCLFQFRLCAMTMASSSVI
ncbi:PAS domain S-box protein [Shewanella phaeophyticola]